MGGLRRFEMAQIEVEVLSPSGFLVADTFRNSEAFSRSVLSDTLTGRVVAIGKIVSTRWPFL